MSARVVIRPAAPGDEAAWKPLWAAYTAFYETSLPEDVTAATWARCLDPATGMGCLLACGDDASGPPIGFTVFVVHAGTWSTRPVCYLEDLFVAEQARGHGAGRALIEALAEKGRVEGWKRIYWQTHASNIRAQGLYDKIAKRTTWIRYDLDL